MAENREDLLKNLLTKKEPRSGGDKSAQLLGSLLKKHRESDGEPEEAEQKSAPSVNPSAESPAKEDSVTAVADSLKMEGAAVRPDIDAKVAESIDSIKQIKKNPVGAAASRGVAQAIEDAIDYSASGIFSPEMMQEAKEEVSGEDKTAPSKGTETPSPAVKESAPTVKVPAPSSSNEEPEDDRAKTLSALLKKSVSKGESRNPSASSGRISGAEVTEISPGSSASSSGKSASSMATKPDMSPPVKPPEKTAATANQPQAQPSKATTAATATEPEKKPAVNAPQITSGTNDKSPETSDTAKLADLLSRKKKVKRPQPPPAPYRSGAPEASKGMSANSLGSSAKKTAAVKGSEPAVAPAATSAVDLASRDIDIHALLRQVVSTGGSDLHLTVGLPPMIRIHGHVQRTKYPPLDGPTIQHLITTTMSKPQRSEWQERQELDYSFKSSDARFRVNAFFQRLGAGAVFRVIPTKIKSIKELELPIAIEQLAFRNRGLVLMTGPTGSGKSTTLAALIDLINSTRSEHILTIEDPIEFVHDHKKCIVNQREVGTNTKSFQAALKSALREDPDIILVGELRDYDTISLAITAAETGHLVFGTLHTSSAVKTIDRIIDVFPPHQQSQIRTQLAETIEGVVAQQLVPRIDKSGRFCATEIMLANSAVRNLIREGKSNQIYSVMQTQREIGMRTLDHSLMEAFKKNLINFKEAYMRALEKDRFRLMISPDKFDKFCRDNNLIVDEETEAKEK